MGSTNVYTEDAARNPVYSWRYWIAFSTPFMQQESSRWWKLVSCPRRCPRILNLIAITFRTARFIRLGVSAKIIRDGRKSIFQFVHHLGERYGAAEVKPGCGKFGMSPTSITGRGTPEEYFKLYDFTVDAVLRALSRGSCRRSGQHRSGQSKAAEFPGLFLDHCAHQKNYVSGKTGSRLDFISFIPKDTEVARRSCADGNRPSVGGH